MENKLDPRVDSDGSKGYGAGATTGTTGTTGTGYGTSTTGTTGTGYGTTGGAGPHSSSIENKLDPRVDSDGSKGYGAGTTTGTGTGTGMGHGTSHTAGGAGPQ